MQPSGGTDPRFPAAEAHIHCAQGAKACPSVSIGLPVYDGERYVAEAIESLLAQSFTDFELIVCDNASTDGTESICRAFAARDPRIRYVRNNRNIGALPNFNLAFDLARGRYFAWAAHDDYRAPTYLAECVAVLERDPSVVLCHSRTQVVDEHGKPVAVWHNGWGDPGNGALPRDELYDPPRRLDSPEVAVRLHDVLVPTRWCFEGFGLMRADVLRRTPKLLSFYGSDKVLLAAMALRGRFHEVPAELFFRRYHAGQSSAKSHRERAAWSDTRTRPVVPPQVRCLGWYLRLVAGAELGMGQRLRCLAVVGRWVVHLGMLVVRQRKQRGFLHRTVYRPLQRIKLAPG